MAKKRKNPFLNDEPIPDIPLEDLDPELPISENILKEQIRKFVDQYKDNPEAMMELIRDMVAPRKEPDITQKEWSLTHPMQTECGSDKFYASLATDILRKVEKLNLDPTFPRGTVRTAVKSGVAYLEDIISDTHVWSAVRNLYRARYGKTLPFYDVDPEDYFEDDLNLEDIKVLVWQAFCRCGAYDGRIFSPLSDGVRLIAETIYNELIDNFDKAPRTQRVIDLLDKHFKKEDYFALRTISLWLVADNPITAVPFKRDQMQKNAENILDYVFENDLSEHLTPTMAYYFEEAAAGWTKYMSLLGCKSSELLSEIVRLHGYQPLADKLLTVGNPIKSNFSIEEVDKKYVLLKNEIGDEFKVVKTSFGDGVDWDSLKGVTCTIIKFGDDYYQNGVASFIDVKPKPTDSVILLGYLQEKQLQMFYDIISKNKGRQIFYCKDMKEVSKIVGKELHPKEVKNDDDDDFEDYEPDNILLLISREQLPIIIGDECDIFKDPKNPYRIKWGGKRLGNDQLVFICTKVLPDDVIDYIVKHNLLPNAYMYASQGDKVGKQIVQENMGFLFRFCRVEKIEYPYWKYDPDDYSDDEDWGDEDDEDFGDDWDDWDENTNFPLPPEITKSDFVSKNPKTRQDKLSGFEQS